MIINGEFIKIYKQCNAKPSGLSAGPTRETLRARNKGNKRVESAMYTKKWTLGRAVHLDRKMMKK